MGGSGYVCSWGKRYRSTGWQGQEIKVGMKYINGSAFNLFVILSLLVGVGLVVYELYI